MSATAARASWGRQRGGVTTDTRWTRMRTDTRTECVTGGQAHGSSRGTRTESPGSPVKFGRQSNELPLSLRTLFGMAADHAGLAQQLGVSDAALAAAARALEAEPRDAASATSSTVRMLQWNVLAEGLSNDGFLVQDVLHPPDEACPLETALSAMDEVKTSGGDMAQLKARLDTPRAAKNHAAVVDWARRWECIKEVVIAAQPDVITLQEFDHMADAGRELAQLGYECALPHGGYVPAHEAGLAKGDPQAYLAHLEKQAVAFAPNAPSTCRKLALRTNASADDDGCAVFWRVSTLVAERIEFLTFKDVAKKCSGAVRVTLRRRCDGASFCVVCTHLSSGDKAADEAARLRELEARSPDAPSLLDWLAHSVAATPTLFCLDANSSPERTEERTVWKVLRGLPGVHSVWDDAFTPDGTARRSPHPVTTNKMRGPLSDQPAKIGQHAYGLIDHIFFSAPFSMVRHACPPLVYASQAVARKHLLPSLGVPSDHVPVIVDLELPLAGRGRHTSVVVLAVAAVLIAVGVAVAAQSTR